MRRLKAIYLVPVALILLIGAGFAFYYFLLKPQIEAEKTAQAAWMSARDAVKKAEPEYQASMQRQVDASRTFFNGYYTFHEIQAEMPNIIDVKDAPGFKDDRERLRYWYKVMGTGQLITELSKWANSFHFPADKTPKFSYSGTLGYEDTLPSAKFVTINFGSQQFFALGYASLLEKINRQTGYGFFPLIIDTGGKVNITVNRNHPLHTQKNPALTMPYTATAYFMTRGWDPKGPTAIDEVKAAKEIVDHPPQIEALRPNENTITDEIPPVLFVFKPEGLAK